MANELKRVGLVFKEEGAVDFKKTLQDINIEMNKNYNQFKLTQAQWDSSTKSTEKLRAEQEYLKNAYEIQADKVSTLRMQLSDLENAENKNTTAIKKKQNELTNAELKLENYKKKINDIDEALNNNGKKLEEWGTKVEKQGDKIEKAGKKLSVFSGATATAMVVCAKSAIDFESAFTGVEKTVDGTEEQMAQLKQGIRDMAKEIPSSTTEISAVAEAAGQLGIQTDNILSFTRTMIDMGNATNLSADEAATTLARFANITKMSQSDFNKLGSVIVSLGNNFATTEAEIAEMGMNLASAGTQVGMTQSEIMALATALSSVGLEAQAGGTAFSKVMVNMQLAVEKGGDSLKDFADVAGMSAKDFQKAFKEDATKAIMKFIEGLSKSDKRGKSAIKVLDDMGITETRLRDALLRSANASDIFSKAIETGTAAWEDNTALTDEANKRYGTLKSQIEKALNKLKDMTITVGEKLMPTVEKVIDKFGKWVDGFSKLSDKEVETIVNIGLIVSAIGPLVTIIGKVTSVAGGAVKGIGTFTQAIKVMKTGTESGSEAANNLAKGMSSVISPAGAAVAGIAAYTAAVAMVKAKVDEELASTKELNTEIQNSINARQSTLNSINEQRDASLEEINNIEILKNELSTLVDENGKVKKGYEARAKFILEQLNKALGTEYKLNNDIIKEYQNLRGEIDELILKKKAQIILEANEGKYKEAIQNKTKAYQDYIKTQNEINRLLPEYNQLLEDSKNGFIGSQYSLVEGKTKLKEYGEQLNALTGTLKTQDTQLQEYGNAISEYQTNTELMIKGGAENLKKIEESVANTQKNITDDANASLKERIQNQITAVEESKKLYDLEAKYNKDAKDNIYETNVLEGQKELQLLAEQLVAQTSTVDNLGQDEIDAWKSLATNSYNTYYDTVSKLPPELGKKIQEMTGVTAERTPELVNETSKMSQKVLDEIEKSPEFRATAVKNLQGMLSGLSDSELRQLLEEAGVKDVNKVIDGIKKGNLAEDEGVNILKKLHTGLSNQNWLNSLWSAARSIASTLSGLLTVKANVNGETSKLPGHRTGLDYVPKDDYVARLHKGERVLTKEENKEYTQEKKEERKGTINNTKNNKYNLTMNIYCQKLDENELDRIFNYMNKRLGMEY